MTYIVTPYLYELRVLVYILIETVSTGPAAEPSGRFPPPLPAGGGGMGTPSVYWQAGGGDLHI